MKILISVALLFISLNYAYADEDYIITDYGQGVFAVEHNGVIHIQGCEASEGYMIKEQESYIDNTPIKHKPWINTEGFDDETEEEKYLGEAQHYESQGQWLYAMTYYKGINQEKAIEMCYKTIEEELTKANPDYSRLANIAREYMHNKDLSMEYYEKYLDQKLNGGTEK